MAKQVCVLHEVISTKARTEQTGDSLLPIIRGDMAQDDDDNFAYLAQKLNLYLTYMEKGYNRHFIKLCYVPLRDKYLRILEVEQN